MWGRGRWRCSHEPGKSCCATMVALVYEELLPIKRASMSLHQDKAKMIPSPSMETHSRAQATSQQKICKCGGQGSPSWADALFWGPSSLAFCPGLVWSWPGIKLGQHHCGFLCPEEAGPSCGGSALIVHPMLYLLDA